MRRVSLDLHNYIIAPRAMMPWPECLTCLQPVDSEELVEGDPGRSTTAKVLVKHHGAEELHTFDFGTRQWDEEKLGKYMQATRCFDPLGHDGQANVGAK